MYNFKQQKIWRVGGVLFLSLLLFGENTVGRAEEVVSITEQVTTESPVPTPTETAIPVSSDETATEAPKQDSTVSTKKVEIPSEKVPMSWTNINNNNLQIFTNEEYKKFTENKVKMQVLGTTLSSSFPGIVYEDNVMVPLDKTFKSSKIKADYNYDAQTYLITISKRDRKIIMHLGSKKALVNGVEKEMPALPQIVVDEEGTAEHIMVPAKFVATALGYEYNWNKSSKKMQIVRNDMKYFSWTDDKKEIENSEDMDRISAITAEYKDGLDILKISCANSDIAEIKKSSTAITVTYDGTVFSDKTLDMNLSDAYIARNVSVKQEEGTVKIVLKKTSTKKYVIQQMEGYIKIIMGKEPIRIAIDCGHGANTPGKRTPPMPVAIDYNHDGRIDFKKGQSIKEHVANVGVGEFLADELERCGFEVYRSAFGATDVSLSNRQKNIKNFNSDYSVSVHFNAAGNGKTFNSGKGVEVFYHKNASQAGQSKNFAKTILKHMAQGTPQVNRGAKTMALALCNTKETGAKASILVECAFMTNRHEAINMVGNEDFWQETAKEIAQGICEYTGTTYVEE